MGHFLQSITFWKYFLKNIWIQFIATNQRKSKRNFIWYGFLWPIYLKGLGGKKKLTILDLPLFFFILFKLRSII